jgi:transposase
MSNIQNEYEYHLSDNQRQHIISQILQGTKPPEIRKSWPFARNIPALSTIYDLKKKVRRTGSIKNRKGQGHPVTVTTQELENKVEEKIKDVKYHSVRSIARELKTGKSTIWKIIRRKKYRSYCVKTALDLKQQHFVARMTFAEWFEMLSENRKNLIWWSDECFIRLNITPNKQHVRMWSKRNPKFYFYPKYSKLGVMIWAAINSDGELLYHIFDEKVTGKSYKEMLIRKFPLMKMQKYWFIQEGAGPHFSKVVTNLLNNRYPKRWIGRGSKFQFWPARSPDLTPCDFFLWGYLKKKIALRHPDSKAKFDRYCER